jgi:hypothetical protein
MRRRNALRLLRPTVLFLLPTMYFVIETVAARLAAAAAPQTAELPA